MFPDYERLFWNSFFPGVGIYHFQIIFPTSGSMFNSLVEPARWSFSQKVFSALALAEFEMGEKKENRRLCQRNQPLLESTELFVLRNPLISKSPRRFQKPGDASGWSTNARSLCFAHLSITEGPLHAPPYEERRFWKATQGLQSPEPHDVIQSRITGALPSFCRF